MTFRTSGTLLCLVLVWLLPEGGVAQSAHRLDGTWTLQKEHSTNIDPWVGWSLQIAREGPSIQMIKDLRAGRYGQKDTMDIIDDGKPHEQHDEYGVTSVLKRRHGL